MIEYINNNFSGFWIALGFILLAAEVLVFGFATIILLFAGLGALLTGLLIMAGLLPETWIAGTACFGISTGVISVALWKPLQKMQDRSSADQKPQSDLVGLQFRLEQDISVNNPGQHRYSGINWSVQLEPDKDFDQINKGQQVEVVSVDVGIFRVKPVD